MDFRELLASILQPNYGQVQSVQRALDAGWLAERSEDYEQAFAAFEQAIQMAQAGQHDVSLLTASALMARLHQAEIRLRQGQIDAAEALAQSALDGAQGHTQRAYATDMIGMLAQAKGDWAGARAAYEQALDEARAAGALGAEGRALGHLGASYLHDGNASYAIHLLRDALAKLNTSGDLDLNSLFTGLLGQALIQSGQESEGLPLIERALRIASAVGYRLYERQWAALLGKRALAEGRYQDAATYTAQVLRLFPPNTVSADMIAAAVQMSKVNLGLRKTDEAFSYAQIALDSAAKLDDAEVQRMVKGAYGVVLRTAGRSSEAIPYLQAAAGASANASADGDHASVDVLRALAAAEVDSRTFEVAVATYRRAIQQAEAEGSVLELAQTRRDLGLAYQKQGDFNAAVGEWSAALAIYEQQRAYAQIARLHCDIGSARKLIGQRGRAIKDYEQGLMALNSLSEGDAETRGLVLSNAANAYAEQGDAESADAFFTESIAIAERLGDRVAEATRCGNYGWFLLLIGRPRRALATLERALAISESLGLTLPAAVQYDNLGLVYDSLGDTALALERHRKALALVSTQSDPLWQAQIKINLAGTLITLELLDEAQILLDEALAQARASSHAEATISAQIGIGRLRIAQGQPGAADEFINEAINLARKIENRRLLAEALSLQSQQQAALDQQAEALAAWDEAAQLYKMLHMPHGKTQPVWLVQSATQT